MNREDAVAIVEPRDRVDVRSIEEVTSQRCSTGIREDTRRQNESDTAPRSRELQHTLDEELVTVDVRPAFHSIDTRVAYEVHEPTRLEPAAGPSVESAAVGANHVPGRIAHDGVETGSRKTVAFFVGEDLGKRERPVQETIVCRERGRVLEEPVARSFGERRGFAEPTIG
jgi:hypothetical protein